MGQLWPEGPKVWADQLPPAPQPWRQVATLVEHYLDLVVLAIPEIEAIIWTNREVALRGVDKATISRLGLDLDDEALADLAVDLAPLQALNIRRRTEAMKLWSTIGGSGTVDYSASSPQFATVADLVRDRVVPLPNVRGLPFWISAVHQGDHETSASSYACPDDVVTAILTGTITVRLKDDPTGAPRPFNRLQQ